MPVAAIGEEFERAEQLKGATLAGWLHLGLCVVKANLVNNKEVECWHCEAAMKHSGNTTNLAANMAKAQRHED